MCEPLKGKKRLNLDDYANRETIDGFCDIDVKSALNWMIQIHEERIEIAISAIEGEKWHPTIKYVIDFIENEF